MKKIFIIFILISLNSCKKEDNDNHLQFKIVDSDLKIHPEFLSKNPFYNEISNKHSRLAKICIINTDEKLVIFTSYKRIFPTLKWVDKNGKKSNIPIICGTFSNKIQIEKNDSTIIYMDYNIEADTMFSPLFWKRDSLGMDELKFYKTSLGEIKYHSTKKISRNSELNKKYSLFEKSLPISEDEQDEIIQ